jgi:uncharacterized protein
MPDAKALIKSYNEKNLPFIQLGEIILDNKVLKDAPVNLVLTALNRHGLIAGSTGSGKTKTMQVLCEQLSLAGCATLVMDIKGDVSGLAFAGTKSPEIAKRAKEMKLDYTPRGFPVEFFTLNDALPGIPLRATLDDFGALLFARMLSLNATQTGVLTVLFLYAAKNKIPLIDLENLKNLLRFAQSESGNKIIEYGNVAASSIGSILRKVTELESQGGDSFFGEPAFKVNDLIRQDTNGLGIISIIRLMDMQDRPAIFSTFMLKLLSDVYREFPELGDPPKPKLVIFLDEAHLIFDEANKALLNLLETTVKLIRSKGVGLIFCTQTPNDIPEDILSQLGLKIQHSLRAFTAKDRQALKLVAQNFPPSKFYNTEQLLTSLGIGEALLSALDAKGQPTPLIQCKIRAPESRMGVITHDEIMQILMKSTIYQQYHNRSINSESANKSSYPYPVNMEKDIEKSIGYETKKTSKQDKSFIEQLSKNTLVRQVVRDFFKWVLGFLKPRRKK